MKKFNLMDFISKLGAAALNAPNSAVKADGKDCVEKSAATGEGSIKGTAPIGGDFKNQGDRYISPKQSVVEMIRRHEALSKRIDKNIFDGQGDE